MKNRELRALVNSLGLLMQQGKPEKMKWGPYNALQMRLTRDRLKYKPFADALNDAEQRMVEGYRTRAGDEVRELPDGAIHFGSYDRDFNRDHRELMDAEAPDEIPTSTPYALAEFDAGGISVPGVAMEGLGSLFVIPAETNGKAIDDEDR